MINFRIVTGLLSTLFLFGTGYSQQLNKEKLDSFFRSLDENEKFMGNILIYKNGKQAYTYSLGYSNLETKTKSGENTLYGIGSISKTITASLVLKAVEEGKLNLSQNIGAFFPSIENARTITIAQLLNHHSGIHNFTSSADFMQWHTGKKTATEMIAIIAKGGSDFEPGTRAEYSNSNYVLLSYILQEVYKKKYDQILTEKIISPLTLKYTTFGPDPLPGKHKTHSYTYEVTWNKTEETDPSIPMGAGAIVMSASDLALFIEALFNGEIISKESLDKMLEQTDGYGMGIFKTSFSGMEGFTHDGKIDGFNSSYYYFPKVQVTYVMLSNAENYNLAEINKVMLSYAFNEPCELPALHQYKVSHDNLTPYLGVYTSQNSPLVITISRNGNKLLAQPKEQKIYTMDATAKDIFKHDKSGVTLKFDVSDNSMLMKQGDMELQFHKE